MHETMEFLHPRRWTWERRRLGVVANVESGGLLEGTEICGTDKLASTIGQVLEFFSGGLAASEQGEQGVVKRAFPIEHRAHPSPIALAHSPPTPLTTKTVPPQLIFLNLPIFVVLSFFLCISSLSFQ
jgi:hypothetical protein